MIHSLPRPAAYNPAGVAASVSTADTSRYRRDGFIVIPSVLDMATVAACAGHLRHLQARLHPTGPIVTASLASDVFLAGIADDPRLTTIAGRLLEAHPVPFGCTFIVKEPGGLPVLWHQDGYPWRVQLGVTRAVTLWIPLDPAGEDNGGLRVIPGSHALAPQPLRPSDDGQPSVFGSEIDPGLVDVRRARQLTLAPGDVSAHHPNLIHGSLPNRSGRPRRALAVRYRPL